MPIDTAMPLPYVRAKSLNLDPIIEDWSKKLDQIIDELIEEDSTPQN